MLDRLQDWWDDMVSQRPTALLAGCALVGVIALLAALALVPRSDFGDAIGLTSLQTRVRAVASGLYWSAAAMSQDEEIEKPQVVYGSVDRLDESGNALLVDLPIGDKWVKTKYQIADLVIIDRAAAQRYFASLPTKNTRLEIFYGTHVVAFVQGEPLNIGLIQAGAASVNPKPPSNMVSRAFAAYYWKVARGSES